MWFYPYSEKKKIFRKKNIRFKQNFTLTKNENSLKKSNLLTQSKHKSPKPSCDSLSSSLFHWDKSTKDAN